MVVVFEKPDIPERRIDAETVSGLGYNPYRTRQSHPNDSSVIAADLAGHFIKLLEKAIAHKGYSVLLSAELEVGLDNDGDQMDGEAFADEVVEALNDHRDAVNNKGVGCSTISKAYLDSDVEICTAPTKPYRASQRVANWHKFLAEGQKVRGMPDYAASFAAIQGLNVGQHLNLSLHKGANLKLQQMLGGGYNVTKSSGFNAVILSLLDKRGLSDLLMIYNGEGSIERWMKIEEGGEPHFSCKVDEKDEGGGLVRAGRRSVRIEDRLPDAACHPNLSMLSLLAATYLALDVIEKSGADLALNKGPSGEGKLNLEKSLDAIAPIRQDGEAITLAEMHKHFHNLSISVDAISRAITNLGGGEDQRELLDQFKQAVFARSEQLGKGAKISR
jgi:hypothetical protein